VQVNTKSRLEDWMGDSGRISYNKLVGNVLFLRKQSDPSGEVKILSALITPGVFGRIDRNKDRFISRDELEILAGYDLDSSDVSAVDVFKSSGHANHYIENSNAPRWFKDDIYDALGSIPLSLKDLVFNGISESRCWLHITNNLLSDLKPNFKETLLYSSGAVYNTDQKEENIRKGKDIFLSTQQRDKQTNEVKGNKFAKHTLNHEFGHAFDFQLYARYIAEDKNSKYEYHSSSERFKNAYGADIAKLKKEIDKLIVGLHKVKKMFA